eukprot:22051_1
MNITIPSPRNTLAPNAARETNCTTNTNITINVVAKHTVKIYPLLSCLRNRPDLSVKLVDLAFEYRDLRNNECHIVGVDLFGAHELQYHSRLHHHIFAKCRALGINRTVHCGDSFDAHGLGLLNAIHGLNPQRIAYTIASKLPKHYLASDL